MPVDYSTTLLTQRLQLVANAIDAGASNGFMRFLDVGGSIVSSFQLSRPCATVTNGVMSFNGLSLIDPAAVGGTPQTARCEDSAGNIVIHDLAVDGATPDITLSPFVTITAGQTVAITAATITGN